MQDTGGHRDTAPPQLTWVTAGSAAPGLGLAGGTGGAELGLMTCVGQYHEVPDLCVGQAKPHSLGDPPKGQHAAGPSPAAAAEDP